MDIYLHAYLCVVFISTRYFRPVDTLDVVYNVTIQTDDYVGSGTDAIVLFKLFGATGWVSKTSKLSDGHDGVFERRSIDTFPLTYQGRHVVCGVAVHRDKGGTFASWGLKEIRVSIVGATDTPEVVFDFIGRAIPAYKWTQENHPVNGGWAAWGGWDRPCTSTDGQRRRTRTCTDPAPACDGATCEGVDSEIQLCSVSYRPTTTAPLIGKPIVNVVTWGTTERRTMPPTNSGIAQQLEPEEDYTIIIIGVVIGAAVIVIIIIIIIIVLRRRRRRRGQSDEKNGLAMEQIDPGMTERAELSTGGVIVSSAGVYLGELPDSDSREKLPDESQSYDHLGDKPAVGRQSGAPVEAYGHIQTGDTGDSYDEVQRAHTDTSPNVTYDQVSAPASAHEHPPVEYYESVEIDKSTNPPPSSRDEPAHLHPRDESVYLHPTSSDSDSSFSPDKRLLANSSRIAKVKPLYTRPIKTPRKQTGSGNSPRPPVHPRDVSTVENIYSDMDTHVYKNEDATAPLSTIPTDHSDTTEEPSYEVIRNRDSVLRQPTQPKIDGPYIRMDSITRSNTSLQSAGKSPSLEREVHRNSPLSLDLHSNSVEGQPSNARIPSENEGVYVDISDDRCTSATEPGIYSDADGATGYEQEARISAKPNVYINTGGKDEYETFGEVKRNIENTYMQPDFGGNKTSEA